MRAGRWRNRSIPRASWLMIAAVVTPAAGLGANQILTWIPAPSPMPVVDRADHQPPATIDLTDAMQRALPDHDAVAPGDPAAASLSIDPANLAIPEEIRWFNARPIRPVRTLSMRVTAYSPDERSCGKFADGRTASGYSVWTNGMQMVAADTRLLPFGTLVSIPGYHDGAVVPVLDRGGRIKGHRLDVLYPTHERARRWGVRQLEITVWEYADDLPPEFVRRPRR